MTKVTKLNNTYLKGFNFLLPLLCAVILSGCHPRSYEFEPKIAFVPQEHHIGNLPHAFSPLTPEERQTDWGKEVLIGDNFAREFDFYRAITSYKRCLVIMPHDIVERRYEVNYNVMQCYYLACRYAEVISSFEGSSLVQVPRSFPAFHDLLLIIYDSYSRIGECEKAEQIGKVLMEFYPETAKKMELAKALETGQLQRALMVPVSDDSFCETQEFVHEYCHCAKSVRKAQFLNAIFPGAGYAYIGQKQSALTSFLINTLFIAGAYQFFHRGYWAAGGIMASLEFGWYAGGINGAGLGAKEWNERLYQVSACNFMHKNKLFPVFMLETTF